MDLTSVADDLYGLAPQDFTAARNAQASEATKAGDKELAASIRRLQKPSASAWIVNTLARHHPDEIDQVLSLGASLREAQEHLDRDSLVRLTRQRRNLVTALTKQATGEAAHLGHPVNASAERDVEQTLQAAMADADAAIALQSGRLLRALATVGFEPVDLSDAVAAPGPGIRAPRSERAGGRSRADRSERSARELEEARQTAEESVQHAEESAAELVDVDDRIEETSRRRNELESKLDELRSRVEEVEGDIATLERRTRELDRERDKARRSSDQARRNAARALERLDRLG